MKKITIYTLILIIIDRISKIIIANTLLLGETKKIIKNIINFTYVKNTGAAFSILQGKQILLVLFTILALFIIYYLLIHKKQIKKIETIIYSLIIGGIIGNLIDRIVYNYVIDFISIKIINYNFPIFNLADTFIVIGAILYIILTIKEEQHGENNNNTRRIG